MIIAESASPFIIWLVSADSSSLPVTMIYHHHYIYLSRGEIVVITNHFYQCMIMGICDACIYKDFRNEVFIFMTCSRGPSIHKKVDFQVTPIAPLLGV